MTSDGADDSRIVKHSVVVAGHRTSISLETLFWRVLKMHAGERGVPIATIVRETDAARGPANLSSALRVRLLRLALSRADAALDRPIRIAEETGKAMNQGDGSQE